MGTVTSVTFARRKVEVCVDGRLIATLPESLLKKRPLHAGMELDVAEYYVWISEAEYPAAHEYALNYLASRARSERELAQAMRRKGFRDETAQRVIERLRDVNLLNDELFAQQWIEQRMHKSLGRRALGRELSVKGIAREESDAALLQLTDDVEMETAAELARKLARKYAGDEPHAARRKLSQALARRGYSWDVISHAMDAALGDEENVF